MALPWGRVSGVTLKRAFGIFIDETHVHVAEVAWGLRGPTLLAARARPLADEPLSRQLQEMFPAPAPGAACRDGAPGATPPSPPLRARLAGALRLPVVLEAGIPDKAIYYSGFPSDLDVRRGLDLDGLISENPRAAFLSSPDLTTDWTAATIGDRRFIFIGAAKRAQVQDILQDFYRLGLDPIRIEPGPIALLRAAWHYLPPEAAPAVEIRALLGAGEVHVTLSCGKAVLAWSRTAPPAEDSEESLYSAIRSLMVFARTRLKSKNVAQVILQGPPIAEARAARLAEMLHVPVRRAESPCFDGRQTALGLALAALKPDTRTINLARPLQRMLPLSLIFPRMQAAVACGAVLAALFSMWTRIAHLDRQVAKLRRENAQAGWAIGKSAAILRVHKEKLLEEAQPLSEYLTDRTSWTSLLETLPRLIPRNARLVELRGEDKIWTKSTSDKDLGERFLIMRLATEFPPGGRVPEAIDRSMDAMRKAPFFKKHFPRLQLAGINWRKDVDKELAYSQIICIPKKVRLSSWEQKELREEAEKLNRGRTKGGQGDEHQR